MGDQNLLRQGAVTEGELQDAAQDAASAHTPGPWTVHKDGNGNVRIAGGVSPDPVTNARYLWVASVPHTQHANPLWRQTEEREANARLIAAAPDLLEAAQIALEEMDEAFGDSCEFRQTDRLEWQCTIHGHTVIGHHDEPVRCPGDKSDSRLALRAAIAKAEGR